jgi:hypothetical protein
MSISYYFSIMSYFMHPQLSMWQGWCKVSFAACGGAKEG